MKKLLILSGKGGTGKTTVATAFIAFSSCGGFCDCDVDAPNLHILNTVNGEVSKTDFIGSQKATIDREKCSKCGKCLELCKFGAIRNEGGSYSINEFSCEGCGVCQLVCESKAVNMNDDVSGALELYQGGRTFSTARLKMGRGNSGKLVYQVKKQLLDNVKNEPLLIFDGSPGIGCPVIASISGMDLVLVVAEPTMSGISDLRRIAKTALNFGVKVAVCVNKSNVNSVLAEEIEEYTNQNGMAYLGNIRYDSQVSKAMNQGKSIVDCENSIARKDLLAVYQNLMEIM